LAPRTDPKSKLDPGLEVPVDSAAAGEKLAADCAPPIRPRIEELIDGA
jgi:hypothetical protein